MSLSFGLIDAQTVAEEKQTTVENQDKNSPQIPPKESANLLQPSSKEAAKEDVDKEETMEDASDPFSGLSRKISLDLRLLEFE